jgi:FkbM family methyltransferase
MSEKAAEFDPELVIEADTDLGRLWVERSGEILTRTLVERGRWDPNISGLLRRVLEPGMTFVDAGANIGYFSVLGSQLVGPAGRVFAVEPDRTNLNLLRANLSRHECSNVTVLPMAAWSERTQLNIRRPPGEGAVARVGVPEGGRTVPAARLDELISGRVDYLKIDCELTDHIVVRGAEGLIRENPAMLISVEFHPWDDSHTGDSPSEILDQYRRMGLRPYEISPVGKGVMETTFDRIASPALADGNVSFDFAMSRDMPDRLLARGLLRGRGVLERAGELLEHIPAPIRPRIRRRDRWEHSGS